VHAAVFGPTNVTTIVGAPFVHVVSHSTPTDGSFASAAATSAAEAAVEMGVVVKSRKLS
jgi:hypothetical protein